MRYITISRIAEGMVLAQPLYGPNFGVLLGEGMKLSGTHINRINELGYAGVYIEDELSENIRPNPVVSADTRLETIKSSREILQQAESGAFDSGAKVNRMRQERIIMPIIEEIIARPVRMCDLIDLKPYDDYVYYHAANVVITSILTGVELGLSGTQLYELGLAALLHDVGNIFIPKSILNKPGKLTPEEFEIIKQHSQMGFDYLREHFDITIEACMGALQHHENYNGTGYPNRLKKDKISIYGRIIAITDVFDALTSRRPYRQPMFPATAMDFIDMNAGTMFDPEIVAGFKNVMALYPSGVCVEVNSGALCIVEENFPGFPDRPRLRLLKNKARTPMVLDLAHDDTFSEVSISHIVEL